MPVDGSWIYCCTDRSIQQLSLSLISRQVRARDSLGRLIVFRYVPDLVVHADALVVSMLTWYFFLFSSFFLPSPNSAWSSLIRIRPKAVSSRCPAIFRKILCAGMSDTPHRSSSLSGSVVVRLQRRRTLGSGWRETKRTLRRSDGQTEGRKKVVAIQINLVSVPLQSTRPSLY
jgi:hypothetical protein